jgi:hypothetical protein|tara:strand:+ start:2184 stop:2450 length:267 start_codon:yes stop_codon:yes gene_type:complete
MFASGLKAKQLHFTGLCGAEIVGRRSVGASEGFLGWIAYLVRVVYFCFDLILLTRQHRALPMQAYHSLFLSNSTAGMRFSLHYSSPVR